MEDRKLYSIPDAARIVGGFAPSTLRNAAAAGELPAVKVANTYLVTLEDVRDWHARRPTTKRGRPPKKS